MASNGFGRRTVRLALGLGLLASPLLPWSMVLARNFNGDNYADLAVGVPGESVNGQDAAGAVNVLYGSASGLVYQGDQIWHQDSPDVDGEAQAGDDLGTALAVGDFDDDGVDDLAIGVPGESVGSLDLAGAVNVLYGTQGVGLTAADNRIFHQDSDNIVGEADPGDRFGAALAVGDFDDDGVDDLAIGVPGESVGSLDRAGAVNVLYGTRGVGLTAADNRIFHQDSNGIPGLAEAHDEFGSALAAGNFGNTPHDDLAIGVPREAVFVGNVAEEAGVVNVLYGSSSGLVGSGAQLWDQTDCECVSPPQRGDQFGRALAAANFGKTTHADLAIGAPYDDVGGIDTGTVHVFYGAPLGLSSVGSQLWWQDSAFIAGVAEPHDNFGRALAAANFGRSSHADLAIGVPLESLEAQSILQAGAVNVVYGSTNGLTATGNQLWHQNSPLIFEDAEESDFFGHALAAANFGRSSHADLAIGVVRETIVPSQVRAGLVHAIYGSNSGLATLGAHTIHQNVVGVKGIAQENDAFGAALNAR